MLYWTKEKAQAAADLSYCKVEEVDCVDVITKDKSIAWVIKPSLLTVDQVAGLLDISKRKVWMLKEEGKLPKVVHPTPHKTRWRLADIMRILE
jgi:predicted DNA-binding transcriptional regulator AlpA